MKKIILILMPVLALISCDNSNEELNSASTKDLLKTIYEYELDEDFDVSISVSNTRTMSAYANEMNNSILTIGSTFSDFGNVGNLFLGTVELDSDYTKLYGLDDYTQMQLDVNNLYGNNITLSNSNCSGSDFCGMNYSFTMPSRLEIEVTGINKNNDEITGTSNVEISWVVNGNPSDLMALVVTRTNNLQPGMIVPQFVKIFDNSEERVSFLGSELSSIFHTGDQLTLTLVRGNQFIYELSNGKKVEILASDIVSYAAPVYLN